MSAASEYYSGTYDYSGGGDIYVHLHVGNIGKAMNGSPIPSGQVANIFRERKNQALQASKTQFKNLFKNSLNKESAELLNEVFNNDDLMSNLQNEMAAKFQQSLAIDKMQALMSIQRSGIATGKFAQSLLSNSKQSIQSFDILLNSLASAASLLNTDSGARLAALLSHQHHATNTQQFGDFLLQALLIFEKQNQKVFLSELEIQQADQIIENIKALGRALQTGKTGSKESLTKGAIIKMVENIFNTGFAESISAMLVNTACLSIDETLASLTGSKGVKIQYSNEFGQAIANSQGKKSFGKADAMFKNVKMKINGSDKQIVLDIGISDKFYKLNNFPGLEGNNNRNLYSSGSGGSLVQALASTFGSNLRYLYYAYNTLGHGNRSGWSQAQGALNEVILTRQIVRLFASRGGNEDFAQFMFVNGQIIPIWNIIMSTLKNISLSASQSGAKSQPVTLSITDRGDIQKAAQSRKKTTLERIYSVNKAVRKAKIKAQLNLNYL